MSAHPIIREDVLPGSWEDRAGLAFHAHCDAHHSPDEYGVGAAGGWFSDDDEFEDWLTDHETRYDSVT